MFFSVDSGTVDAPSYPAIAVWANPAKPGDTPQKCYLARAWLWPPARSTENGKGAREPVFAGYSSSLI
jgi:hypothetical protein